MRNVESLSTQQSFFFWQTFPNHRDLKHSTVLGDKIQWKIVDGIERGVCWNPIEGKSKRTKRRQIVRKWSRKIYFIAKEQQRRQGQNNGVNRSYWITPERMHKNFSN